MSNQIDISSLLNGSNAPFIAELYSRYLENPGSVDPSWQSLFGELRDEKPAVDADVHGASWAPKTAFIGSADPDAPAKPKANGKNGAANGAARAEGASLDQVRAATLDSVRALMLIRAYRIRGHLAADLDPLGMQKRDPHPELEPTTYGFTEADYDRPIFIDGVLGRETATLREIMTILRETYCGTIGVEFMHMSDPEQKSWIQQRIEAIHNRTEFTDKGKRAILERLTAAEIFEKFADKKYTGTKRFGLDGAEALIPMLEQIIKRGGQLGMREMVIGMPHRGRLNVLTNFMGKSFAAMFSEFQGNSAMPDDVQGSGDVKYHLGTSSDREFDGAKVHLSLTANPSHLECVNPVSLGKVRAKQMQRQNLSREEQMVEVMGLLMHGDAAFAGQGVVAETMMLSELRGYRTGGTIHVVVNNQIGFTTSPQYSRSAPYPTDFAKGIMAPIFHVNGDDPEAVVHVARIATEFRQRFLKDAVIDMICYRRHGHNEGDEPSFTQPIMYRKIASHETTRELYGKKLVADGMVPAGEPEKMVADFTTYLETQFELAKSGYKPNKADWLEGSWSGLEIAKGEDRRGTTDVPMALLKEVGDALTRIPENFNAHRTLRRVIEAKRKTLDAGIGIDWATGEALAFGTLLTEGAMVRLSGQDSGRGTFSQRHAVWTDQETEAKYLPLAHVHEGKQALFEVIDSPLSEFAVLGFDYGFSLADPKTLALWEAQFGDFANGAQTIIDQFISSGESKWLRMSGLVMLLPHGYEGQGPEHSSAHPERYLALCAEDNMQVCNLTTPANYFHVLRRQMHRPFRKPLIIFSPKSLLRHKLAVSKLEEMGPKTTFHRVLWDDKQPAADDKIKRIVLCTGKVYFDLFEEREKQGVKDTVILRIEQLYPFPFNALTKELVRYKNAKTVVWCQEEPKNLGYWQFVEPRLEEILTGAKLGAKRPRYVGRPKSAATATGSHKRHSAEQAKLVNEALSSD